jgi:hypothetical protein
MKRQTGEHVIQIKTVGELIEALQYVATNVGGRVDCGQGASANELLRHRSLRVELHLTGGDTGAGSAERPGCLEDFLAALRD